MAEKIGSIYAELEAKTDKFNSEIDKAVKKTEQSAGKIGKSLDSIVKGFAAMGAAVVILKKVVDVMKQLEASAREQEMAFRKIEGQVTATGMAAKRTAGQIIELANTLQSISNFSDAEILEGVMSQLLKFQKITGDTFDRAAASIVDMAAVTGSLEGAAQAVGMALESPIEGITRLRRQGIIFSEEQKAQIQNFVETNRLAEAQGVILEKLQGTFGGMAEKMAEPAIQLKNAWGDLQDELGYGIMNATNDFATKLIPKINEATDFFAAMNYQVRLTTEDLKNLSIAQLEAEIENVNKHLKNLEQADPIIQELTATWNVLLGVLIEIGKALWTITKTIGSGIGGLIALFSGTNIKTNIKSLTKVLSGHVSSLVQYGNSWTNIKRLAKVVSGAESGAESAVSKLKLAQAELNAELIRAQHEGRGAVETIKSIEEAVEPVEQVRDVLKELTDEVARVTKEELEYLTINEHIVGNVEKAWDNLLAHLKDVNSEDSREFKLAQQQKLDDLEKFKELEGKVVIGEIEPVVSYDELMRHYEEIIALENEYKLAGIESAEAIKSAYDAMLQATATRFGDTSREYQLLLYKITQATRQQSLVMQNLLAGIGTSFTNNLSNAILDTITSVRSLEDAFRQFGRAVVEEIGRIIIKLAVLASLKAAVGAVAPALVPMMFASGINQGGQVKPQKLASGGIVGVGSIADRDSVTTSLTRGEFVVNRQAAVANLPLLESINAGGANVMTRKLDRIAEILAKKEFSPNVNVVNKISPIDVNRANNIGKSLRGGF